MVEKTTIAISNSSKVKPEDPLMIDFFGKRHEECRNDFFMALQRNQQHWQEG